MSDQYYLPASTTTILNDHLGTCQNLALILDKYLPQRVIVETKNKGAWLQSLIKDAHIDTVLAQSAYNRWYALIAAMNIKPFYASLDWRMAIGLGGESVLETDITLHHLYGIPFIPASALKGLTRAYVTGEIEGYKSDKSDNDNEEVKRIFGSQEHAGTVIFFDAMPTDGKVAFVLDIMNPHYPEYYAGSKSPTNDQNPIPVTFLTVTDTTFTFALAPRNAGKEQHVKDMEQVKTWLQEALQKYGVGGKTSAGYGYFQKPTDLAAHLSTVETSNAQHTDPHISLPAESNNSQPPIVDPDIKKAEGYIWELDAIKDVAGQIHGYYQKWRQLTSQEARLLLARAIIEKVRKAGREKVTAEKAWYRELQTFLGEE